MITTENVRLLCVEDDPRWQRNVEVAANTLPGISVDKAETYQDSICCLNGSHYDLCTLDSRLADGRPHIHQIIGRIERAPAETRPELIALTHYEGDISPPDNEKVLLVRKGDVADMMTLKRHLVAVLRKSILKQAKAFFCQNPVYFHDLDDAVLGDDLLHLLKLSTGDSVGQAEVLRNKFIIYKSHSSVVMETEPNAETLLDCYGNVRAVCQNGVEVDLLLRNGYELPRVFSPEVCSSAGVHYRNAFFRYRITRIGSEIKSRLDAEVPPEDYPGLSDVSKVDLSVFDRLD